MSQDIQPPTPFRIEQIAFAPPVGAHALAQAFLRSLGWDGEWVHDTVIASGTMQGADGEEIEVLNKASLSFNYDSSAWRAVANDRLNAMDAEPLECELISYRAGNNWLQGGKIPCISHLGMHCTEEELTQWKAFFAVKRIPIAQEVETIHHTSAPRKYHYCIFNTRPVLGTDLKFIVRKDE